MPADTKRCIWITWETQRRNVELASAFGCDYLCLDMPGASAGKRYLLSSVRTIRALITTKPSVVFAQSPSLVLVALLAGLKKVARFLLVIDAHNVGIDYAIDRRPLVRALARFALRGADFVLVSNRALAARASEFGARPLILPDKLPEIKESAPPAWLSACRGPIVTLISTFSFDEPIGLFIEAFKKSGTAGTLCITGKREKAGALLEQASDTVRFTGFLPEAEYEALIRHSDLLVDLTTQGDCLVCGAYEAVAVGVPVLLSDSAVVRETFPHGCLYAENTLDAYVEALRRFAAGAPAFREGMHRTQAWFPGMWESCYASVRAALAGGKG